MADGTDLSDKIFSKLGETFSRVRLKGGVVARTSQVAVSLSIVWALIVWKWSADLDSNIGLVVIGLIASCVFLIWNRSIQSFAERNPAQAMLEGAEFLKYVKFEAQAKGGNAGDRQIISDPTAPRISSTDNGEPDVR